MNEDRGHGAMPKLFGAPAYARPPVVPVAPVERPVDPDDLPLESARSDGEPEPAIQLAPTPYTGAAPAEPDPEPGGELASASGGGGSELRGRPFRLRLPGRSRGSGARS